jgi:phosphoenolpyruvate-protein kinase (PTS system EI component)
VHLVHQNIQAVVTETCGMKSHTAILARGFGIPMVAGIDSAVSVIAPGSSLLLDATAGTIVIDADEVDRGVAETIRRQIISLKEEKPPAALEPITRDGVRVSVLLNISDLIEAQAVSQLGADGVGLYRTEFMYLNHACWPTEDQSYEVYARVAQALGDRELNIRLADFGAEKSPPYADIPVNRNPSLGIRGMRLLLSRDDILRPQVLALDRLARERPLTVLLPMVDTMDSLEATIYRICQICRCRNRSELPFRMGIMVEVPSAAYLIAELIGEVDSVSIGLNDLTQYLLAADRDDELVEVYHDALQPAVLRMVAEVIRTADMCDKPVTMCGELAGNPNLAQVLLALGARRFSVSRSHYRMTVALVRSLSIDELTVKTQELLRLNSGAAVRRLLSDES